MKNLRLASLIWFSLFYSSMSIVFLSALLVLSKTILFNDGSDYKFILLPDSALGLLAVVIMLQGVVSNKRYVAFAGLILVSSGVVAGLVWHQLDSAVIEHSWFSQQSRLPLWQCLALLLLCLPWLDGRSINRTNTTIRGFRLRFSLLCNLLVIVVCMMVLLTQMGFFSRFESHLRALSLNNAASAYSALFLIMLATASFCTFFIRRRTVISQFQHSRWLLVGVIAMLASLLWFNFAYQLQAHVSQSSVKLAERLQHNIDGLVKEQRGLMYRLAERITASATTLPSTYFDIEFQSYLRDFSYIDYLAVKTSDGQLQHAEAQQQEELLFFNQYLQQNADLFTQQLAEASQAPQFILHYDSAINHAFIIVTLPADNRAGVSQLVAGVDFSQALNYLLPGTVPAGYFIQLVLPDQQSILYDSAAEIPQTTHVGLFSVNLVPELSWQLRVFTNLKTEARSNLVTAELMLVAGWLATLLMMLSEKLYQQSQQHRIRLLASNDKLRHNISKQKRLQAQHQQIMANSADMICVFDANGLFVEVSASCLQILGYSAKELVGKAFTDFIHPEDKTISENEAQQIISGKHVINFRNRYLRKDGSVVHLMWVANYVHALQLMYAVGRNVNEIVKSEQYQSDQQTILRMISTEQPLTDIFTRICQMAEQQSRHVRAVIMLKQNQHLLLAAAPSLSDSFKKVLNGIEVTDNLGSCGTAAYQKSLVLVSSIASDEKWRFAASSALAEGLLACWSMPMVSLQDTVLGTFALYCSEAKTASKEELELMLTCSRFAAVAMERAQQKRELQQSDQRYRSLFEFNPEPVYVINPAGYFVDMNEAGCQLLQRDISEITGTHFNKVILPEHLSLVQQHFSNVLKGNAERFEASIVTRTDQRLELYISLVPNWQDGQVTEVIGMSKDITQRLKAEQQLRLFKRAVDATSNGVIIADVTQADQPISYVNPAFEKLTGYTADEAIGRNCRFLQGAEPDSVAVNQMRHAIERNLECNVVLKNYRKDKSVFWNQLFLAPVPDESGQISHYIGVQTDITPQKRFEEELAYNASHDLLTGLPNRALLKDRLIQSCHSGLRRQHKVAVLFIDLDTFKLVNDSLGHLIGDEVLKNISQRISHCIRPGDTLARVGGDEFVLLLTELSDAEEVVAIAERILHDIGSLMQLNGQELHMSASIGISISDSTLAEPMQLVQQADLAMYRAKYLGRNNFQWYSSELEIASGKQLNLRAQLKKAIANEEFELYYQPQIDALSGDLVGLEALLRWPHAELGFISPDEFIPLAETTGEIVPLSIWVFNQASQYNKSLIERGIASVVMAVNVSSIHFGRNNFVEQLQKIIEQNGLVGHLFEIELTESLLFENIEQVILKLQQVRQLGVKISIDDFGTGYSSLNYLKRLPIDKLKIDRSFIKDVVSDKRDAAISKAIIAMAHHLDIRVIAEGVETEAQVALLRKSLCDEYQGYYFAKPMPAAELEKFIRHHRQRRLVRPDSVENQHTILLVDDEENILSALQRVLRRDAYRVLTCTSAKQAFDILALNKVQVILSDQRMPGCSGTEFFSQVKDMYPDTIRIVLSGYTDLRSVTEAINKGAIYKFMTKPWQDDELRSEIKQAFLQYKLQTSHKKEEA